MTDGPASIDQQKLSLKEILGRYTSARVALGHAGPAIPTTAQLLFQLDHASARDAVHAGLDVDVLLKGLKLRNMECLSLESAVAGDSRENARQVYLRRPDLGRRLSTRSALLLENLPPQSVDEPGIIFVIADGLSALAVERHALPLLDATLEALSVEPPVVGPVCIVKQGRVAIGDEIGSLLRAKLSVVLIGERPGLSSPDSLGVYITWNPHPGCTDAERNCISNIRHEGLGYDEAAERLAHYIRESKRQQLTGVNLKEKAATSPSTEGSRADNLFPHANID